MAGDNYEAMKRDMARAFLRYDQERMIERFSLSHDAGALTVVFFGRSYQIDRRTGIVSWQRADGARVEADYNEAMTIYDVLCNAKEGCRLAGEWVNLSSLSSIMGGSLREGGHFFSGAGRDFAGRTAELAAACARLGGRRREGGDLAFEFELFPFLPLLLRFWDADEDFPASLQFLLDRNILDYMHYETLMFALSHALGRIRGEMAAQADVPNTEV